MKIGYRLKALQKNAIKWHQAELNAFRFYNSKSEMIHVTRKLMILLYETITSTVQAVYGAEICRNRLLSWDKMFC